MKFLFQTIGVAATVAVVGTILYFAVIATLPVMQP